jgi:hypothetical protein
MKIPFAKIGAKLWNRILHFCGKRFWTITVQGDLPTSLRTNTVYVVMDEHEPWYAAFVCPCGCKSVLHMNLLPDERPCWRLSDHNDGTVSIEPSIFRKVGCESHFWIRRGRIDWCRYQSISANNQDLWAGSDSEL